MRRYEVPTQAVELSSATGLDDCTTLDADPTVAPAIVAHEAADTLNMVAVECGEVLLLLPQLPLADALPVISLAQLSFHVFLVFGLPMDAAATGLGRPHDTHVVAAVDGDFLRCCGAD